MPDRARRARCRGVRVTARDGAYAPAFDLVQAQDVRTQFRRYGHGLTLWRRKPWRTCAAQGVQHQWQRQVLGETAVVARSGTEITLVDVVVHGWTGSVNAVVGTDAGVDVRATSTAPGGTSWEP